MQRTLLRRSTLVKIGRGAGCVTESSSNALLDALQTHGYCYVQHPFIQKSILDQLHRDCRIFFEQYILNLRDASAHDTLRNNNSHNYSCSPLSEFEIESIRTPTGFRGYYKYIGASGVDDPIDCFSIGRNDVDDPAELRRDYYRAVGWEEKEYLPMISRKNPWATLLNHTNPPSNEPNMNSNFLSDFHDMFVAYYDMCNEVSIDVLRHISCGLGIRPTIPQGGADPEQGFDLDFFTGFHAKRDCDLQAKYYPTLGQGTRISNGVGIQNQQSVQNPDGVRVLRRRGAQAQPLEQKDPDHPRLRLDTHKDLSTVTLLAQDALGGLEVWDDEREQYLQVPVLQDALLVNAGMFLEKWTGGLIEATPHRVRNVKEGSSRCSIVFFHLPDHDARIEPLLQQDDNPSLDAQEGFLAGDLMPSH